LIFSVSLLSQIVKDSKHDNKLFAVLKYTKMKTSEFKGNLSIEKAKLKQKFASLTDDDLLLEEGRAEEISGKHQSMLFQTEEELDKIISTLSDGDRNL